MSPNLTLTLTAMVLIGSGVYLLLARSVVRALLGFLLMGNGVNLLYIVASGPPGAAPILRDGYTGEYSDPVPQALVLTAIVITLALTGFVLALAHRAWQLGRSDLLADDTESAKIHKRAESNDVDHLTESLEEAAAIQTDTADDDAPEGDSEREDDDGEDASGQGADHLVRPGDAKAQGETRGVRAGHAPDDDSHDPEGNSRGSDSGENSSHDTSGHDSSSDHNSGDHSSGDHNSGHDTSGDDGDQTGGQR